MLKKLALLAAVLFVMDGSAYAQTSSTNQLVCGDASTCPNQRGTTNIGGDIVGTAVMTLDYWSGIAGASSALNVSVVTPTSTMSGVSKVMQMQRKAANTNTAVLNLGQVIDTDASTYLQGKTACLSFVSMIGATFSPASAAYTYTVTAGTGAAQGYASMIAGTWTGTNTVKTGTVTGQTLPQTTSACFQVPATTTELGVNFSFTPVGTAGATDWVQFSQVQLAAVTAAPASAVAPPYAFRAAGPELDLSLRRAWVISEPAASVSVANGSAYTTALCNIVIPLPAPMRAAPTLTFGGTALGATTWALISASATPIVLASTYLVQSSLGANTAYAIALKATGLSTPFTVGLGCQLVGAGGGSSIIASADLL